MKQKRTCWKNQRFNCKNARNGYVNSKIINEGNKLKVVAGRINKVNLKDEATKNLEFKKKFLGLHKLEGKILQLDDVEKIVASYKKINDNNIKISIDKASDDFNSDINITNIFKPNYDGDITLKIFKIFTYNIGLKYDQLLGLNDSFKLNTMILPKDMYLDLKHKINFVDYDLTSSI